MNPLSVQRAMCCVCRARVFCGSVWAHVCWSHVACVLCRWVYNPTLPLPAGGGISRKLPSSLCLVVQRLELARRPLP